MTKPWMLDELAHADPEHLDPAFAAARRFGRVTAVDISRAMLQALREPAATGVANLRCVQAGFLSYQHAGPPADAVYSRNALHQTADFWQPGDGAELTAGAAGDDGDGERDGQAPKTSRSPR
jgi:hypothetical protein